MSLACIWYFSGRFKTGTETIYNLILHCVCAGGMQDIFEMMMGGGGGRGGRPRDRKSEDVVHKLQVSLDELYNGAVKCVGACLQCQQCTSMIHTVEP